MEVPFAKCLDRPVDIFGIKGKWITIFLVLAGASIVVALALGFIVSSGIGISAGIILVVTSFVVCLTRQSKTSYRQVTKAPLRSLVIPYVMRGETLCRILHTDKRFAEVEKRKTEKALSPDRS